jgi:hypothetical protein
VRTPVSEDGKPGYWWRRLPSENDSVVTVMLDETPPVRCLHEVLRSATVETSPDDRCGPKNGLMVCAVPPLTRRRSTKCRQRRSGGHAFSRGCVEL